MSMLEPLLAQLTAANGPAGKHGIGLGGAARVRLYLNINNVQATDHHRGVAAAFDRHKSGILPVLVHDCLEGNPEVKQIAMEILGHLAGMAESMSPFQLHQASSLWSTVARVLRDGSSSHRLITIAALFAISHQTMGPSLMEAQAPVLAPAVAKVMQHQSTVVRKEAAAAIHCLLGDAPVAMARCATIPSEEEILWAPALLCLCLDDSPGVRAEALKAARRALRCLQGQPGISAWVLGRLDDGSLYTGLDRILYHHREVLPASSATGDSSRLTATSTAMPSTVTPSTGVPSAGGNKEMGTVGARTPMEGPSSARVKHAVLAWAVHLSLTDADTLMDNRYSPHNTFDRAMTKLLKLTNRFKDPRPSVRMVTVDAWELFVSTCLANVSPHKAAKVSELVLKPFANRLPGERDPAVREALLSSLQRCVGSFPSQLLRYLWTFSKKSQRLREEGKGKNGGLADLLTRMSAGAGGGEDARHCAAFILAALLPCSQSQSAEHPSLRHAELYVSLEVSKVLPILHTLMLAFPAPSSEISASSIGALATTLSDDGISARCFVPVALLAGLPTSGLILRAWCGLALWAITTVRGGDAHVAEGFPIGGDSEPTTPVDVQVSGSAAPPSARAAAGDQSGKENGSGDIQGGEEYPSGPLRAILGSVLQGVLPAGGAGHGAGDSPTTTNSNSGAAETSGVTAAETLAARRRKERMAEWNSALFPSLVRVLSMASANGINRTEEGHHSRQNVGTRAEPHNWLHTSVSLLEPPITPPRFSIAQPSHLSAEESQVTVSFNANDRSGGHACSKCRSVQDVVGVLLRERGVGGSGRGSGDVSKSGTGKAKGSRKHAESNPQENLPLWIWLLVRGLRDPCDCHPASSTSIATVAAQRKNDASLLCEILDLSPKGGLGQVLAALSQGAAALTGNGVRSDGSHSPIAETTVRVIREKKQQQREEMSVARIRDSCIHTLAEIWGAEASRNLCAWGTFREHFPLRDVTGGNGLLAVEFDISTKRSKHGGQGSTNALHQPNALLVGETDDSLRAPLKLALLLSHLPEMPSATVTAGEPGSATGSFAHWKSRERSVDDEPMIDEEPAVQSNFDQDSLVNSLPAAGGKPWGSLGSLGAVFGPEAASLWSKLFAARQGHSAGFAKGLLRRLSKDCASLAFSAPQASSVPSYIPVGAGAGAGAGAASDVENRNGQLRCDVQPDPLSSGGWGLAFSQTQLTQTGAQGAAAADREGNSRNASQTPGSAQKGSIPKGLRSELGPSPPSSAMPLLATVTLSLLRASTHETGVTRIRAWGAGLSSLAWLLASPVSVQSEPRPLPPPPSSPKVALPERCAEGSTEHFASSGGRRGNVAGSPAVATGTVCATELGDCLDAVHRSVASWSPFGRQLGKGVDVDGGGGGVPFDKESLAPLCRFLASGVGRWSIAGVGAVSDAGRVSCEAACLFSVSPLRHKTRAVTLSLLSAVKGLAKEALASSDVLGALSPLLIAILDLPRSREADRLQSSLLDTWNSTFGILPVTLTASLKVAFPAQLLANLAAMSGRAEVKMPPGIVLQNNNNNNNNNNNTSPLVTEQTAGNARKGSDNEEVRVDGEQEAMNEDILDAQSLLGDNLLGGQTAVRSSGSGSRSPGFGAGVAGMLSAACARRSFIPASQSSPANSALPKAKRSPSPSSPSGRPGGSKFVRVLGSGRGNAANRPGNANVRKRAAITTHTSLDGSQVDWSDDSQLPDTEPDSEPELAEQTETGSKPASSTPSGDSAACSKAATSAPASSLSTGSRLPVDNGRPPPGQAVLTAKNAVDVVKSGLAQFPRGVDQVIGDINTSDRQVHPRLTSGKAGCVSSRGGATTQQQSTTRSSPQQMCTVHNTRIPKGTVVTGVSPPPSSPRLPQNDHTPSRDVSGGDVNRDLAVEWKTSTAREQKNCLGFRDPSVVVEDAKRLAQNLAAVKGSLSVQQLQDFDSILRETLRDIQGMKKDRSEVGGEKVL